MRPISPDRSESTRGDSKFSHEIEGCGQPVQDGAQTLKSHSIQKEATRIVCVLLTSNAIEVHTELSNVNKLSHWFCRKIACEVFITVRSVFFLVVLFHL